VHTTNKWEGLNLTFGQAEPWIDGALDNGSLMFTQTHAAAVHGLRPAGSAALVDETGLVMNGAHVYDRLLRVCLELPPPPCAPDADSVADRVLAGLSLDRGTRVTEGLLHRFQSALIGRPIIPSDQPRAYRSVEMRVGSAPILTAQAAACPALMSASSSRSTVRTAVAYVSAPVLPLH
jgi:hypothetical protein